MNRLILLLSLSLLLPFTAHADEASQRAKAKEMVLLLHSDRMVTQISANFMKQLSIAGEKLIGPNATPESKAQLADLEKKFSQMIDDQVGWKVMEPALTDIYAKTFTEDELTTIVAFYKSPAGAALIEKMPTVNTAATQLLQSKMTVMQPQMKQMYEDFQRSQVTPAKPPTLGPPSGPPAATPPPASTPK
ncbi:MAG TPA: DUF2059 domain-containing protein [Acidobacteriaceae bacterium]